MKKIALKYGLWMFVGFTAFFLFMQLVGASQNYNLRVLNGLIHISLIYLAIQEYYRKSKSPGFNYLEGVAMGMAASVVGVLSFTIFQIIYLGNHPTLMQYLQENVPLGEYLNPYTAGVVILTEGLAISFVSSYIITRLVGINLSKA